MVMDGPDFCMLYGRKDEIYGPMKYFPQARWQKRCWRLAADTGS